MKNRLVAALLVAVAASPLAAQDDATTARLIDEGMNHSQVQQMAHELIDGIGPRLTNSTNMRRTEAWAVEKMEELGLANVRKEGFHFGRGWEVIASDIRMVGPRPVVLTAIPVAWTPGTNGVLEAEIVVAPISKREDFDAYRGKLAGKIVLISKPGTGDEPTRVPFTRLDAAEIGKRDSYDMPDYDPDRVERGLDRRAFALDLDRFLAEEGAVAWAKMSYRDGKLLHGTGYTHYDGMTPTLPGIEIAAEDYRRLARIAKEGAAPRLAINSNVRFLDDDMQAYNVIGEIPGKDPKAGYIMAGAHFDSWFAADGAVDNGAGTVTVLEAARIIKSLGIQPRRAIRFALWNGEEQGLHGSTAYARRHLVSRAGEEALPAHEVSTRWRYLYPVTARPGYAEFKGYFNMDNGSGKIRGIHAEGDVGAARLLSKWFAPYRDMGAASVVAGSTGSTDHAPFQNIGLPAYQFIQDPLDYFARLHHTSVDTYDHLRPDDLRQAAVVMAGVLWAAANDGETIPSGPIPREPVVTNPFEYKYPHED